MDEREVRGCIDRSVIYNTYIYIPIYIRTYDSPLPTKPGLIFHLPNCLHTSFTSLGVIVFVNTSIMSFGEFLRAEGRSGRRKVAGVTSPREAVGPVPLVGSLSSVVGAAEAEQGLACRGLDWPGETQQARIGWARPGQARCFEERFFRQ